MTYGLYDGDMGLYPSVPFFNLELMKMATYYKKHREIVNLSLKFNPNKYSHFIVRQDYPSKNPYSTKFHNVTYGGRAFDGELYRPMDNEIEICKPDTHLYDKLEPRFLRDSEEKVIFSTMRRAEHIRLSLDGKTIWKDFDKQLRRDNECFGAIFHDYNLNDIEGAYEVVQDIVNTAIKNQYGRRLGMKFPLQVTSEEDFLKWMNFKPMGTYYSLQYNGILTCENAEEILHRIHRTSISKQTFWNPTYGYTYEQFITKGIIDAYKAALNLRRYHLVFPLIYDRNFFIDFRWEEVFNLIQEFLAYDVMHANGHIVLNREKFYTMYSHIIARQNAVKKFRIRYDLNRARRIFQFVRDNNYELFKLFYEYTGEKI